MSKLKALDPQKTVLYSLVSVWIAWVIIHYLGYRPNYFALFYTHPYSGYLLSFGLLTAASGAGSYYILRKKKKWVLSLRPWWLIILSLILSTSIIVAFRQSMSLNLTPLSSTAVYFWLYSLCYLGALLVVGLGMAGLGNFASSRLPLSRPSSLLSIAIGFSFLAFYSVILGLMGMLHTWALWPVIAIVFFFQRKYIWTVLQSWLFKKIDWRIRYWWEPVIALLGVLLVAFYWVGSIKAFPVGFDGAALYANLAHLTAEQHVLPAAYQAFGWSVVMSWGELLFGSLTVSILLSHFMYLPAAALLYQIFRHWLKPAYALMAIVLTFSIPMWSFHAMADEKIDLGFLFICLSIVYLLLDIFSWKLKPKKNVKLWKAPFFMALLLVGWLSGFAFSIKYTAILLLAAWIAMLCYHLGRARLMAFWLFFFLGFIFLSGFHSWGNIPISNNSDALILGGMFLVVGFGFLASVLLQDKTKLRTVFIGLLLAGLGFSVAYAPWAGKHLSENRYELSTNTLLFGNPVELPLFIPNQLLSYERRNNKSPRDFTFLLSSRQEGVQGQVPKTREERRADRQRAEQEIERFDFNREEVQRYIGYEKGIFRYTSIPFDLTFDQNVRQVRHKDIGFVYLALLPILFLAMGRSRKSWLRNGLFLLIFISWLASSFWSLTQASDASTHQQEIQAHNQKFIDQFSPGGSVFLHDLMSTIQSPFNALAAQGDSVFEAISSMSILVYIPLLVLILMGSAFALRHRWQHWPVGLRQCMIFCFAFFAFWCFLGNAIVWYALPAYGLLIGLLVYYWQEGKALWGDDASNAVKTIFGAAFVLQISISIIILFSSNMPGQSANKLFNWPMIEYVSQVDVSKDKVYSWFSRYYQDISKKVNSDPDARILRINTYLQFHLDNNNNRVLEDNQLNAFKRVTDRLKSPKEFIEVLKTNGFKYIIYDVNSPTIDETPEQSLREKCGEFLRVMFAHPDVEVLITDNFVADESLQAPIRLPNGQMAKAKPGVLGETVYRGNVILFGIK